ncbi:hypothetical protein AB0N14_35425 [Streptomyces sp. NPDC051104]|uniref:hypothetical protein n=1 Tax=Streptomyces sp. NPDC051104 TaxID=3155044 RepID=UPI00343B7D93
MRAIRLASAAMLGVSALALTACTTAVARGGEAGAGHSGFSYNLEPAAVAPGGRINLPVRGCNGDAKVFSGAFDDDVTIPRGRNSATVTVGRNALPGTTFDVLFQCGHQAGHRQLVMTTGRNDRDDESRDEGSGRGNGRGEAERPQHGVHAGEGGSIGGFDLKKTGLGAALVLVSVGTAWHLTRRRGRGSTS